LIAPEQGKGRETWMQAMRIGDLAIVGVPGELFTCSGELIKRRSPFPHTYIAGLANDWIGYIPNKEGFQLGGYQVWTGTRSYVEPGTGERVVESGLQSAGKTPGRLIAAHQAPRYSRVGSVALEAFS
jgi:hypothetical protein